MRPGLTPGEEEDESGEVNDTIREHFVFPSAAAAAACTLDVRAHVLSLLTFGMTYP